MIPDIMTREALRAGLCWLMTTVQPEGAQVHPLGESVVLVDRMLSFRVGREYRAVVLVENADGPAVGRADRLAVERLLSEAGHYVVAHTGFAPEDPTAGTLVLETLVHPSLAAAVDAYDPHALPSARPAAVRADFTRVLEAECQRLRVAGGV